MGWHWRSPIKSRKFTVCVTNWSLFWEHPHLPLREKWGFAERNHRESGAVRRSELSFNRIKECYKQTRGEAWLMGAQLIGLPIRHRVRREGVDQRSIAARKHVRESYRGRLLTAGGDVFGNLILTQRNSLIGQPQKWTGSSWGSRITAVEGEIHPGCRCGAAARSYLCLPIRALPHQSVLKYWCGLLTNI